MKKPKRKDDKKHQDVELQSKSAKKNSKSYNYKFIYLIFTVILFLYVSLIVYGVIQIDTTLFIIFSLILLNLPFLIYLYLSRKSADKSATLNTAYSTLIILNLSIYPLVSLYNQQQAKIKNKVSYTVGFRAWKSECKISNIRITYWDEFGNQLKLDDCAKDSSIWHLPIWKDPNDKNDETSICFAEVKNDTIHLKNCGIALNLPALSKRQKIVLKSIKDCKIEADFTFIEKYKEYNEDYYSVQVCLKIPTYEGKIEFESYLGYELFFYDVTWSKLLIPDFNVQFLDQRLIHFKDSASSSQKVQIVNFVDKIVNEINHSTKVDKQDFIRFQINPNSTCRLSAILNRGTTSLIIKNPQSGNSAPLFEFFIPENDSWGAFIRE